MLPLIVEQHHKRKESYKQKKLRFFFHFLMIACLIFSLSGSLQKVLVAACLPQSQVYAETRQQTSTRPSSNRSGTTDVIPLLVNYYFENALWHEPSRNVSGQSNVFNFYSHHVWWHLPTFSLTLKHPWGSYSNQKQCRFLPQKFQIPLGFDIMWHIWNNVTTKICKI